MIEQKLVSETSDWQIEMTRIATKHHVIVCWVAIILNPLWFVIDYYTMLNQWENFLIIRLAVALFTFIAVFFRNKIKISTEALIFIPGFCIAIQNAYMWSFMDVPMFQKHAFAYIALFIGVGMLALWKPIWSILVLVLTLLANIFFLKMFSILSFQEILINGGLLVATVAHFRQF